MRQRLAITVALTLTTTACGGGGSSGGGTAGSAAAPVTSAAPGAVTPPPAPAARVAITPRGLSIDGQTALLYGGEVQYYRIRDPHNDVARTHRLWEETLDLLASADMNLVTTYVPWDVHEPQEGRFDFSGVNDLEAFLAMCHRRGMKVIFKPGPFINSEWPYGLGSFGAVPEWFKQKHPASLARKPDGSPFTTDLLGGAQGRQPSLFAPELLQATEAFFARLAPIVQRFVHQEPCIFSVQLDNETNFYFADRYAVDYSTHALAQYRGWLRARYGTIAALNAAYGTSHADFDQVDPPRRAPDRSDPAAHNVRHQDWFDAGQAGIVDFHLALRAIWERLGVREPDVLFCTNDSPHTMYHVGRNISLWHGGAKNAAGLAMLDAYPKQLPTSGDRPLDMPFLTAFFSDRFATSNDAYAFAGGPPVVAGKCYSAELEGGLFSIPLLNVPLPVPASSTDHILLQHIGRGSVLAAVYVLRAGLNRDNSPYFANAALDVDGRPQPRWQVLRRWGRAIRAHGDALLDSQPVARDVAVVFDSRFDAPAGGVAGPPGRAQVDEAAAVFGLLLDSGHDPVAVDLRDVAPGDLDRFAWVVFPNPDVVHQDAARALDAYVRGGGTLVNLMHLGRHDESWRRGTATESLLAGGLFSDGVSVGLWENTWVAEANVNLRVPGGPAGPLPVGPFIGQYRLGPGATALAWDRTFPLGHDGEVTAWTSRRGAGEVVAIATNPAGRYASAAYYDTTTADLLVARGLVRWVAARAGGKGPVVSVSGVGGTAWARVVPGRGAIVFLQSRLSRAATLTVDLHDLAALGLSPGGAYDVEEALTGAALAQGRSGADLARQGLAVPVDAFGTAVLVIE